MQLNGLVMMKLLISTLLLLAGCNKKETEQPNPPQAPALPVEVQSRVLSNNLNFPWEILYGPDNRIWLTERGGKISRADTGTGAVTLLHTITEVVSNGEGGLLGMVLHPAFATQPYVYVAYNYNAAGGYREKVVRLTFTGSALTSPLILIDNMPAASIHNGCRLAITADQKLLITTGDAANTGLPQNTASLAGKVLRLNLDGSIPADNPLAGNPVWSWGHRNAQGLVLANGVLYSSEHGPNNDDEVNIIEKGRNYGWPTVQGFCDQPGEQSFCASNSVKEPLRAWTPTVAVSGMDYYNNDAIPQWKNSLLLATLKDSRLLQLYLNGSGTAIDSVKDFFVNTYGRLRDVCVSPDGKVYMCTSNGGNTDRIVEVRRK
jgi:aldose sugar dehydrogenase